MSERFEQPPPITSLRKKTLEDHLASLDNKRPIEKGRVSTMTKGPYAHTGVMVIEINNDGSALILPTPESIKPETVQASELWAFADYDDAFQVALKKHPFTQEE